MKLVGIIEDTSRPPNARIGAAGMASALKFAPAIEPTVRAVGLRWERESGEFPHHLFDRNADSSVILSLKSYGRAAVPALVDEYVRGRSSKEENLHLRLNLIGVMAPFRTTAIRYARGRLVEAEFEYDRTVLAELVRHLEGKILNAPRETTVRPHADQLVRVEPERTEPSANGGGTAPPVAVPDDKSKETTEPPATAAAANEPSGLPRGWTALAAVVFLLIACGCSFALGRQLRRTTAIPQILLLPLVCFGGDESASQTDAVTRSRELGERLTRIVADPDEEANVRIDAARKLGAMRFAPAIPVLVDNIRLEGHKGGILVNGQYVGGGRPVRGALAGILARFDRSAIPVLVDAYVRLDPHGRTAEAQAKSEREFWMMAAMSRMHSREMVIALAEGISMSHKFSAAHRERARQLPRRLATWNSDETFEPYDAGPALEVRDPAN